jgi:hypothetical protein
MNNIGSWPITPSVSLVFIFLNDANRQKGILEVLAYLYFLDWFDSFFRLALNAG